MEQLEIIQALSSVGVTGLALYVWWESKKDNQELKNENKELNKVVRELVSKNIDANKELAHSNEGLSKAVEKLDQTLTTQLFEILRKDTK